MLGRSIRSRCLVSRRLTFVRPSRLTAKELMPVVGCAAEVPVRSRSTKPSSRFAYPEGMKAYEDDWCEEPEYPLIDPEIHKWNEFRRERLQKVHDWRAKIRNSICPESKNLEMNMPRQFGYKVFQIKEDLFGYDCLAAYKYVTRTHVESSNQLPSHYSSPEFNEKVEYFKEKVKAPLLDALAFELDSPRACEQDFNEFSNTRDFNKSLTLVPQINRVILSVLGKELDYLKDSQVDVLPRVEAFWFMGGQEPSRGTRSARKGNEKLPKNHQYYPRYTKEDDPVEEPLHYVGKTLLQVRCRDPPKNFLQPSDPLCERSLEEFPDRFQHFLKEYGFRRTDDNDFRYASIIPGHWSGDAHRCNLVAFHPRHHLKFPARMNNKYWGSPEENEEALLSQAMLASFGRLLSQAFYHGFDQFTDLEYPFSTQTIITNGLDWSFFAYQMNTMKFDKLSLAKNQKQNVMWGTQSQSIFDKEKKGELNDEVLGNLLRFYLNAPEKIQAENPTPYLGKPIQEWGDDKGHVVTPLLDELNERAVIYANFKDQVCQRNYVTDNALRYRPPEIYEWERIYKLNFQAMPLEARRRFFELPSGYPGSDPLNEPYKLKNPLREGRGVRRLREAMEAKKEQEAVEASKKADTFKYGVHGESSEDTSFKN